ncbi:MAG: hypothetical protein V2A58_04085 [Planctomycetota bacterium]
MSPRQGEVVLSDFNSLQPAELFARRLEPGKWTLIDYSTEPISGTLLCCSSALPPPPAVIPLPVEGWHAIHLGVGRGLGLEPPYLRLSCDTALFPVAADPKPDTLGFGFHILEGFWKCADLTRENLIVAPSPAGGALFWLRLVPLSGAEVDALIADRAQRSTRKLIALLDTGSWFEGTRRDTPEKIAEVIEPLRDTDFEILIAQIESPLGHANFLSKHLELWGDDSPAFADPPHPHASPGSKFTHDMVAVYRALREHRTDALAVLTDRAHAMGLRVLAGSRFQDTFAGPFKDFWSGRFVNEHPEYLCRDKADHPIPFVSWAYPPVRERVLATFRELLERGMDGLALLFVRSGPLVLYEAPVIQAFRDAHKRDPRELDDADPDWLRFKADLITGYLREIRRMMDAVAQASRRERFPLFVEVDAYGESNMLFGLDVKTWAHEGLIDAVIASDTIRRPGKPWHDKREDAKLVESDYRYFIDAVEGTRCRLYQDMLPRVTPPNAFRRKAKSAYEKGAHGLAFWDLHERLGLGQWATIRRLGHPDELERDTEPRFVQVRGLGGLAVDHWHLWWTI